MTKSHSSSSSDTEYLPSWKIERMRLDLIHWAKYRAEKKGQEFSISPSDIHVPARCPVYHTPFIKGDYYKAASLDRIDSSKGYVKGNVIVVSRRANVLKSDATVDEMVKLAAFYSKLDNAIST